MAAVTAQAQNREVHWVEIGAGATERQIRQIAGACAEAAIEKMAAQLRSEAHRAESRVLAELREHSSRQKRHWGRWQQRKT